MSFDRKAGGGQGPGMEDGHAIQQQSSGARYGDSGGYIKDRVWAKRLVRSEAASADWSR